MLGIIILIFLSMQIRKIAIRKGERPFPWIVRTITAWVLGELMGNLIIMYFLGVHFFVMGIFGVGLGLIGYLLIKQKLEALPDDM